MPSNFRNTLFSFLTNYIGTHASSPSFSEMIEAMGISPNSKSLITRTLRALEKEGKIILSKDGRRLSISLANTDLPLLGHISAGKPIETISENRFVDLNQLFQGSNRFALQVKGNSMQDEGIFAGDIIICKRATIANEGDIAVVLIDHHNATLKRISYQMKGVITLIPANSAFKPRAYTPERISIQGIYVGLIRV